jgi:predicted nucleic acid-binding protein
MAGIYLDANVFIDLIEGRKEIDSQKLSGHEVYISPLTLHILIYLYKYQIPSDKLNKLKDYFNFVDLTEKISNNSLQGPTKDFEDNIQLHSAVENDCNLFISEDKKLLKMKFFGRTKIISPEEL